MTWLESTDWLDKLSDQKVNFTDALSFVLMRREKIPEAFTFDRHFEFAGFTKSGRNWIEVHHVSCGA